VSITLSPLMYDHMRRVADGIVAVVGSHCEVVIHDFSDLGHSAIYIAGDLTGRRPGAPVPDLSFIKNELDRDTADQLNYLTTIEGKTFQSTTVWLRDIDGAICGAVCINIDNSGLIKAREIIDMYTDSTRHLSELTVENTFARDLDHLIGLAINSFMAANKINDITKMNSDEKIELVQHLDHKGFFQIRGTVNRLADILCVSRASIYNYRSAKEDKPS